MTATSIPLPSREQRILRLAAATIGAAALMIRTFGVGLAADPTALDQRLEDRTGFGALGPETVALIVTTPALVANSDEDDDDSELDEDEESEIAGLQGIVEKKNAPSAYEGLSIETLKLGVAKTGYVNRCWDGYNYVTVVVKNNQQSTAESILVRVYSDGKTDRAKEQAIVSLPAGQSTELSFDDVYIKKGNHKLTATARLIPSKMLEAKSKTESEQSYATSKTIRVKCDDKDDKEEAKEA